MNSEAWNASNPTIDRPRRSCVDPWVPPTQRMSAGFAWRLGFADEQLMDSLVRDSEDGGSVAHADPSVGERCCGFPGLRYSRAVRVASLLSGLPRLLDGPPGGFGQHRAGSELDGVLVGLE